jgi:hypothetical protein
VKTLLLKAAGFLSVAILFSIIYTQSPLYTSNQNQYFLHGFAQAGVGNLADDWLANSLDPTPLFSLLVRWVYQITQWEPIFYLIYAILMWIYFYSIVGIVGQTLPVYASIKKWKSTRYLVFLALFLTIHSAALRYALSLGLGDNWTFLFEDGVADQRMLGLVLQPSTFGVFLLLSIYLFLKRQPYWAMLSHVFAASMHPTYLLSAGVLTLTYTLISIGEAWYARKNDLSQASTRAEGKAKSTQAKWTPGKLIPLFLPAILALLSVLPILTYVFLNFGNTPPASTAQAQDILVNYRIPHHALVKSWFDATAILKIGFICLALILVRKQRLFWVLAIPFTVAIILTLVQVISGSNFLALLFPWRMSIFLVPLSTTLILAWIVSRGETWLRYIPFLDRRNLGEIYPRKNQNIPRPQPTGLVETVLRTGSYCLVIILVFIGLIRIRLDFQRKAEIPEAAALAFIAQHHSPGEIYLTSVKMQDFRLAAQSAQYVDFKAIPYRDEDVLEWYRRIQLANAFYKGQDCTVLNQLANEGISHILLPLDAFQETCAGLSEIYRDENYGIYQAEIP